MPLLLRHRQPRLREVAVRMPPCGGIATGLNRLLPHRMRRGSFLYPLPRRLAPSSVFGLLRSDRLHFPAVYLPLCAARSLALPHGRWRVLIRTASAFPFVSRANLRSTGVFRRVCEKPAAPLSVKSRGSSFLNAARRLPLAAASHLCVVRLRGASALLRAACPSRCP